MRALIELFPGEIMPDILPVTAYQGVHSNGNLERRYVEAVGPGAAPKGHVCSGMDVVRYRRIFQDPDRFDEVKYEIRSAFKSWLFRTGASVDIALSKWAQEFEG